ncbi:hypothetical protein WJX72_003347 [[Myrmecia] bisecta]|uniref:AP2/ERF domain-containing protein n=1 Tax=[Myrmecia] bisecta TaxID=41462 RepID=A0AAW1PJL0_9CHLO
MQAATGPRKAAHKIGAGMRRTSRFRGVTHHCRTGRWEAHIWEEGKQIYLGGFDAEEQAALAYDVAAIKFRTRDANTNYDISNYEQELAHFNEVTKEEVVLSLRRQSKGFQKTSSQFRGVTHHQKGKWEARIGQMVGKKYKYLGLFHTEVEAARAYDRESVLRKGINAITNFDLAEYLDLLDEDDAKEALTRMAQTERDSQPAVEGDLVCRVRLQARVSDPDNVARADAITMGAFGSSPGCATLSAANTATTDCDTKFELPSERTSSVIKRNDSDQQTPTSIMDMLKAAGSSAPNTPHASRHDTLDPNNHLMPPLLSLSSAPLSMLSSGADFGWPAEDEDWLTMFASSQLLNNEAGEVPHKAVHHFQDAALIHRAHSRTEREMQALIADASAAAARGERPS